MVGMFILLAATAAAQCVTPVDGTIAPSSTTTTLCSGPHYLNNTNGGNGAILVQGDGVLDCNGTILIGNGTANAIGNQFGTSHRITVKNCILYNFNRGIWINTADNATITNNEIRNFSHAAIYLSNTANNNLVINNTLINDKMLNQSNGISMSGTDNNFSNILINNTGIGFYSVGQSNNTLINNISIYNSRYSGFQVNAGWNFSINNSRIMNPQISDKDGGFNITPNNCINELGNVSTSFGFYNVDYGSNLRIDNTYISNFGTNLYNGNSVNMIVNNVTTNYSCGSSIADHESHATILNCKIYNSGWNGIRILSNHSLISNNYIENFRHHGIDTHSETDTVTDSYYNITAHNNIITQTDDMRFGFDSYPGIFFGHCLNCTIYYNSIENLSCYGGWVANRGIGTTGGNLSAIFVYNNSLKNICGQCFWDYASHSTYQDNIVDNCTGAAYHLSNSYSPLTKNSTNYAVVNKTIVRNMNYTIQVHSTVDNLTNVSIFEQTSLKIQVEGVHSGHYVNVYPTFPFNDIYNASSGQILATNQSAWNGTLSVNDTIIVADFTDALNFTVSSPNAEVPYGQLAFSGVSNNGVPVTSYWFGYSGVNYTYPYNTIIAEGIYNITLYGMDAIGSVTGTVYILAISGATDYTNRILLATTNSMGGIWKFFFAVAIAIVLVSVIALFVSIENNRTVDYQGVFNSLAMVVIFIVIVIISIIIIGIYIASAT